jgi:aminoglycoside phosphotransferase (APT) family kinase protein
VTTSPASWAPERLVALDQAERLIAETFPALSGHAVRPLAAGWDNSVFLVGEDLAFRFPRRAMAVPGIRREIAVLPAIAPLLPLPIPTPAHVGLDDHAEDPWPFFGAPLVPGIELAQSALPEAVRVQAARDAGTFLRALHSRDTLTAARGATDEPLPHDPMHRAWPRARITDTRQLLETLANDGAWDSDVRVQQVLENAIALEAPTSEPALTHGDLHVRHLLVETTGNPRATGVIDWGDLCIGDPAMDLSLGYAAFEGAARTAFVGSYGDIDAERELRARALAIRLCATLATYALATDQKELAAESLKGLGRAVT